MRLVALFFLLSTLGHGEDSKSFIDDVTQRYDESLKKVGESKEALEALEKEKSKYLKARVEMVEQAQTKALEVFEKVLGALQKGDNGALSRRVELIENVLKDSYTLEKVSLHPSQDSFYMIETDDFMHFVVPLNGRLTGLEPPYQNAFFDANSIRVLVSLKHQPAVVKLVIESAMRFNGLESRPLAPSSALTSHPIEKVEQSVTLKVSDLGLGERDQKWIKSQMKLVLSHTYFDSERSRLTKILASRERVLKTHKETFDTVVRTLFPSTREKAKLK